VRVYRARGRERIATFFLQNVTFDGGAESVKVTDPIGCP
jgi:hypothetical protein